MVKLCYAAVTDDYRLQHAQNSIRTEAMPLGEVINRLLAS
jgi:hypothetical protein